MSTPQQHTEHQRRWSQPKNAWGIVMRREIVAKLTDKAFLSGTILTLALIIGATALGIFAGNRGTRSTIAVTTDQAAAVVRTTDQMQKATSDKNSFTVEQVASEEAARKAVSEGDADAWLRQQDGAWTLVFNKKSTPEVTSAISQAVQAQLMGELGAKAGMNPEQLTRAGTVQTELVDGGTDKALLTLIATFAFSILFFMSSLTFGMQIAGSVVEEKSSRIVEIISAAIPVRQLLAGKVIGNTLMALGQMALFAIAGLVGLSFTPYKDMLPAVSTAVVWFLVYFIAGFLALACVWAVAGSLASRQEDLQSTTTPLTMMLTLVYMAGFFASGTLAKVLSFVPVISSVLMPARLVAGDAEWWELVVGLLLNLAFAAVTVLVGERIYRRALLQTQGVISYRQALKLTD